MTFSSNERFDQASNVPAEERPVNERKALSVSAALNIAKSIISENAFHIVGEVSELNQKPGYKAVYFTIKDENSALPVSYVDEPLQECRSSAPFRCTC